MKKEKDSSPNSGSNTSRRENDNTNNSGRAKTDSSTKRGRSQEDEDTGATEKVRSGSGRSSRSEGTTTDYEPEE